MKSFNKKIAFVTQSYKPDYDTCKLLFRSLDKFASPHRHYIFVNDEDYSYFQALHYGNHIVMKKSTVLPWYFFRLPFKLLGHHFYLSPFTFPMREWVMQQMCKLGVFEVIDNDIEAVFHIDSECVMLRPFNINNFYKEGKYILFRSQDNKQRSHAYYIRAINSLFNNPIQQDKMDKYDYMAQMCCFVRENTESMLKDISKSNLFKSWKIKFANTYRPSEFYIYGNYCANILKMKNHYVDNHRAFKYLRGSNFKTSEELKRTIDEVMDNEYFIGVWIQKGNRDADEISVEKIEESCKSFLD